MSKGSFLLTRPNHEGTVLYLFAWAEKVLEFARAKNIFSVDLPGESANKNQFTSSIKKFKPSFIYLNGHGSQDSVTGFDNLPVLTFADNEEITKDAVVYALSCQSAKRLGKSCVSRGARAYLGYDDDFIFVFDENSGNNLAEDKVAANFLTPSNELAQDLLDGKSTGEAFDNSQNIFEQSIVKFSLSDATVEQRELLPYLLWDHEHQVCLGDKTAKCKFLSEEEFIKQKNTRLFIIFLVVAAVTLFILTLIFWK